MLKVAGRLWVRGLLALMIGAAAACGAASSTGPDPVLLANQQLEGQWRLQDFVPAAPLEAPLTELLRAQVATLIITFRGGQFTAVGPGINARGRYEISSSTDEELSAIVYDADGVPHHVKARFDGNLLRFQSVDAPWDGAGTLVRA